MHLAAEAELVDGALHGRTEALRTVDVERVPVVVGEVEGELVLTGVRKGAGR